MTEVGHRNAQQTTQSLLHILTSDTSIEALVGPSLCPLHPFLPDVGQVRNGVVGPALPSIRRWSNVGYVRGDTTT